MGLFDNLSKTISQVGDRAKFEADKFQRTTKLQGEINDLKRQIDTNRLEFGDRAIQLYRAGQIQSPTLGELLKALDALQASITLKEEELKRAQADVYIEPATPPPTAGVQQVPISTEPAAQPTSAGAAGPVAGSKFCSNCRFQMPTSAVFCPNCGARQGA
ncbi:MAG: zinc ribbon domain-containing protein [Chloroflexi bacterium SZAS-1]|nr:zinc ribbon domain-containing protein [Chloroflexi bacterium SZAS-1]HNP86104.1 zinc-ribbon domain-containing protein [Kouleothrix sp.]